MKPAPPAASKPHMLYINRAIIPDPEAPEKHDAYGINAPELVIYTSAGNMVDFAFRGTACRLPWGMLPAFLASVGFRALGRLENRTGVKQRPEDFDLTGAVNDLGPRLRALREQTGLRIGEFARAVGGSLSQLSSVELGEWQEDRQAQPLADIAQTMNSVARKRLFAHPWSDGELTRELAHRLAGIAIGALIDARYPLDVPIAFLQEESTRELVASAVAEHLSREGAAP